MLNSSSAKWLGLLAGAAMTLLAFIGSVMLGTTPLEWSALWRMLTAYDPANVAHIILYTERLPRAVVAALVGASLAVAGALMQTMTRNPLASPGILGINAGAMFFVVVAVALLPLHTPAHYVGAALLGALVAASLVALLSRGRYGENSPLRVVLSRMRRRCWNLSERRFRSSHRTTGRRTPPSRLPPRLLKRPLLRPRPRQQRLASRRKKWL